VTYFVTYGTAMAAYAYYVVTKQVIWQVTVCYVPRPTGLILMKFSVMRSLWMFMDTLQYLSPFLLQLFRKIDLKV